MKKFWLAGLFLFVALGAFGEMESLIRQYWAVFPLSTKLVLESRGVSFVSSEQEVDRAAYPRVVYHLESVLQGQFVHEKLKKILAEIEASGVMDCKILITGEPSTLDRVNMALNITVYFPARP